MNAKPTPALRPARDPARSCWALFSVVLQRSIVAPDGEQEAREQLRQLFQEALSTRPERLLAFSLTGEPWSRRLEAFALALAGRPTEGRFVTGTEYLIAKLHGWNPPATTDWHPEDGGIVAHLRARTMEILAAFYDERYRQEAQTPPDPRLERIAQAVGPQGPGAEIR
jgi:hypothetical protein